MPTLLRYDDLAKAIASDSRFFFLSGARPAHGHDWARGGKPLR